jgi:hypothetical protein
VSSALTSHSPSARHASVVNDICRFFDIFSKNVILFEDTFSIRGSVSFVIRLRLIFFYSVTLGVFYRSCRPIYLLALACCRLFAAGKQHSNSGTELN